MLQFTYASGGYLRGADYDQKHSYRSCCPHSLYFCRFGRATDSSSRRDECKCQCGCVSGRLAGLLLTMLGQIIVTLTSAGSGTDAPLKVSMW
jgi:hypothetical protein